LIQRVRRRSAFQQLTTDGTRIRRTALWCTWCPDLDSTATSVAFALPSALGPAVARNRLRRRLRELLREIDRATPLPTGTMLVGARPRAIELTFDQLRSELTSLLAALPCNDA
jgi:ribonuclease P protein component